MDQKRIGKYIAECRKAKGLTQKSLADLLLVSDKAVSKWERGICLPDIGLLVPLTEILDISVNSLLLNGDDDGHIEDSSCVVTAARLYSRDAQKKEHRKAIIVLSILVLLFAIVTLTLHAKYSASRYNDETQDAWVKASTSIIEVLDLCVGIEKNEYRIDEVTHLKLNTLTNKSIDCLSDFQDKTKEGETVNSLSKEASHCIYESLVETELNAVRTISNGNKGYACSETEIQSIETFLSDLPKIHDSINVEMGVNSPGITGLFGEER